MSIFARLKADLDGVKSVHNSVIMGDLIWWKSNSRDVRMANWRFRVLASVKEKFSNWLEPFTKSVNNLPLSFAMPENTPATNPL